MAFSPKEKNFMEDFILGKDPKGSALHVIRETAREAIIEDPARKFFKQSETTRKILKAFPILRFRLVNHLVVNAMSNFIRGLNFLPKGTASFFAEVFDSLGSAAAGELPDLDTSSDADLESAWNRLVDKKVDEHIPKLEEYRLYRTDGMGHSHRIEVEIVGGVVQRLPDGRIKPLKMDAKGNPVAPCFHCSGDIGSWVSGHPDLPVQSGKTTTIKAGDPYPWDIAPRREADQALLDPYCPSCDRFGSGDPMQEPKTAKSLFADANNAFVKVCLAAAKTASKREGAKVAEDILEEAKNLPVEIANEVGDQLVGQIKPDGSLKKKDLGHLLSTIIAFGGGNVSTQTRLLAMAEKLWEKAKKGKLKVPAPVKKAGWGGLALAVLFGAFPFAFIMIGFFTYPLVQYFTESEEFVPWWYSSGLGWGMVVSIFLFHATVRAGAVGVEVIQVITSWFGSFGRHISYVFIRFSWQSIVMTLGFVGLILPNAPAGFWFGSALGLLAFMVVEAQIVGDTPVALLYRALDRAENRVRRRYMLYVGLVLNYGTAMFCVNMMWAVSAVTEGRKAADIVVTLDGDKVVLDREFAPKSEVYRFAPVVNTFKGVDGEELAVPAVRPGTRLQLPGYYAREVVVSQGMVGNQAYLERRDPTAQDPVVSHVVGKIPASDWKSIWLYELYFRKQKVDWDNRTRVFSSSTALEARTELDSAQVSAEAEDMKVLAQAVRSGKRFPGSLLKSRPQTWWEQGFVLLCLIAVICVWIFSKKGVVKNLIATVVILLIAVTPTLIRYGLEKEEWERQQLAGESPVPPPPPDRLPQQQAASRAPETTVSNEDRKKAYCLRMIAADRQSVVNDPDCQPYL